MTHSHDTATPALSAESEHVLVPREPTEAMIDAADRIRPLPPHYLSEAYRAMIAAAPAPNPSPTAKGGEAEATERQRFNAWFEPAALATPSPQPADAVREAVEEARSLLKVEYYDDGRIAAVGHDSDGLRKMVALLDAALSTPTEGPASQTEGMGGDAGKLTPPYPICNSYMPDYQAGGDCVTCGRVREDHAEFAALTPPETAEAVPDDLTAAYMAGVERGRDELRAERDEAVKALRKIEEEAKVANDVIRLNRDGQGQGRIRVATAMHRIAEWTRAALATEASR